MPGALIFSSSRKVRCLLRFESGREPETRDRIFSFPLLFLISFNAQKSRVTKKQRTCLHLACLKEEKAAHSAVGFRAKHVPYS